MFFHKDFHFKMINHEIDQAISVILPVFPLVDCFRNYVKTNKFLIKLYVMSKKNQTFHKYFIKSLIKAFEIFTNITVSTYTLRLSIIEKIFQKAKIFYNQYVTKLRKNMPNNQSKIEKYLQNTFGKNQYHISSSTGAQFEQLTFHNLNFIDKITSSQATPNRTRFCSRNVITPQMFYKEEDFVKLPCNSSCIIPNFWATSVFEKLSTLKSNQSLNNLIQAVITLESCKWCEVNKCNDHNKCQDLDQGCANYW